MMSRDNNIRAVTGSREEAMMGEDIDTLASSLLLCQVIASCGHLPVMDFLLGSVDEQGTLGEKIDLRVPGWLSQ